MNGSNSDGGYVLDGEYDCYISAGISTEESFSRDFIKNNCYGFDGTIPIILIYSLSKT